MRLTEYIEQLTALHKLQGDLEVTKIAFNGAIIVAEGPQVAYQERKKGREIKNRYAWRYTGMGKEDDRDLERGPIIKI